MPVHDPEGAGRLLLADGEPDHAWSRRLAVSEDVERLAADTELSRAAWIARAETVELVTAAAAVAAGERLLAGHWAETAPAR